VVCRGCGAGRLGGLACGSTWGRAEGEGRCALCAVRSAGRSDPVRRLGQREALDAALCLRMAQAAGRSVWPRQRKLSSEN
jgi:hypothetical protein